MNIVSRTTASSNAASLIRQSLIATLLIASSMAHAAIPPAERNVLIALYNSMNGDQWFYNANWCTGSCPTAGEPVFNQPGTECTWTGVTCDSKSAHVVGLYLPGGTGSLADLSGLTKLENFSAPAEFGADRNYQLTGPIPDLAGLKALQIFFVADNQLSGSIPPLAGLANLQYFDVSYNSLSGELPDLAGLTSLQTFNAGHNQLSGSIPALSGFTSPLDFDVSYNHLTGSIPTLQANALSAFVASHNNLTGTVPPLDGLANLGAFQVDHNQLSGSITVLNGLNLLVFDVSDNQLTGPLPSLSGLHARTFYVQNNYLTGTLPAPPSGLMYCEGISNIHCEAAICPNSFDRVDSPAWDAWLGVTPWWATPYSNNQCDDAFTAGFD